MLRKGTNKFSRKTSFLFVSPILLGLLSGSSVANAASILRSPSRASSISSSISSRISTSSSGYKLTKSELILGSIGIGVAGVSLIGTAVGLGMTEHQYKQNKESYEKVIDRTYYSFFEEREQSMKDLFNEWSVPMPDKYKNPLKDTTKTDNQVTGGFSIGKGD